MGSESFGHMVTLCLTPEQTASCFPKWLYYFAILLAMYEGPTCSIPSPKLVIFLFDYDNPSGFVALICISLIICWGSKITADGDCSHEIKRCLLLGRKVMTNLDSILKGRDITLPTKVCLLKAMVFPVVTYGCESWTLKKAEH